MANPVVIPVKISYSGQGWDQLSRDAKRAEQEMMRVTRNQISAQRNLARLTSNLDKTIAPPPVSLGGRIAGGVTSGLMTAGAGLVAGLGVAQLAEQAAQFGKDAVMMADRAAAVERSFVGLSGGAEQAAANMGAMSRATKDLISDTQQQQIANQLLGMNIATNAGELEKVVNVSRRLGKEFKQLGAKEAADDFALMISNQSIARLDSFGISSGAVKKRIEELQASTKGMTREQAFFTATMEEADKVLARLGPEVTTTADRVDRLSASWTNLQTALGTGAQGAGVIDIALAGVNAQLEAATTRTNNFNKILSDMAGANIKPIESLMDAFASGVNMIPGVEALGPVGIVLNTLADGIESIRAEEEAAAATTKDLTAGQTDLAGATEAAADALKREEKELKRLEAAIQTQRSAVADLLNIEKRHAADSAQAWADWQADVSQLNQDTWKQLEAHGKASAKRQIDIQKSLARDLKSVDADTGKALEKERANIEKRDRRASEDMARAERQERKRANIDALADERLFNLELLNMASEGDAIGIQRALERRAVEEQIAAEKGQAEQAIQDENAQVQQRRQQEDDAERVRDIRQAAAERKAELATAAAEAIQLERERLAETIAAENEAYDQRRAALDTARVDKLLSLEQGRAEAIEALGLELAQIEDLTTTELGKITAAAGKIGKDVGAAFAEGVGDGVKLMSEISDLLGQRAGGTGPGADSGRGLSPERLPQFATGGDVPGPLGAPMLAVVHGGEHITPAGQSGINLTVNVNGVRDREFINRLGAAMQATAESVVSEYDDQLAGKLN